ncbi:cytochrome ubiquinol oxidase subunit I [Candidatus Heimdallarchaeota archaeon B3_Heim]|nr:MAG: cytochrome ubiquinol oxidase subunit I [Candidatus Heimdallarchaeota archaeon B3_Heim]
MSCINMINPTSLAQIQFYITIGFHFIFPPLSIGLSWYITYLLTRYIRSKEQYYKDSAWFWIKLFATTVAIGIPTGVLMEFQFGMNWSEFSRFVGEVFATFLLLEVFFAFFLESVFLGVILSGMRTKRISDRVLWFSSIMITLGTTLSSFWILAANSWMQTPGVPGEPGSGWDIVGGKAVLTNFWDVLFTPSMVARFFHTVNACLIAGAFFIIGISCLYLLKDRHHKFAYDSIKLALIVGIILSIIQGFFGHWQSTIVATYQPAKFAAQEGLFETTAGAPLVVFAILDDSKVLFEIGIPFLLSLLTWGDPNAIVTGLDAFALEDRPSVLLTFYSFHLMVIIGMFLVGVALVGVFLLWKKSLSDPSSKLRKWFLRLGVLALPLPLISIDFGWITTESGRQPWIIQGILRTADAASAAPSEEIILSLITYIVTYIVLFIAWILVMRRIFIKGPSLYETDEVVT